MNVKELRPFLKDLAKGLAEHFGPQCEVAVHDLTSGYEGTIFAIENGHVSGRQIGDSASEIVLEALKHPKKVQDHINYLTRTKDGRLLKSSSIYIRGDEGVVIALVSINYDITTLSHATSILNRLIGTEEVEQSRQIETIVSNVNDLLDQLIEESYQHVGKPVALMTKEDKIKAIHYLDEKGAFLIKKSGDRVSNFYDISKYTLYKYLDSEVE